MVPVQRNDSTDSLVSFDSNRMNIRAFKRRLWLRLLVTSSVTLVVAMQLVSVRRVWTPFAPLQYTSATVDPRNNNHVDVSELVTLEAQPQQTSLRKHVAPVKLDADIAPTSFNSPQESFATTSQQDSKTVKIKNDENNTNIFVTSSTSLASEASYNLTVRVSPFNSEDDKSPDAAATIATSSLASSVPSRNATNKTKQKKDEAPFSLTASIRNDKEPALLYGTDHIVLANRTYHYRYPLGLRTPLNAHNQIGKTRRSKVRMLIAVSSASWNTVHRQAIRESWGQDPNGLVFIVAGNWTHDLEQELAQYQDLMWLNRPEDYYWGLTPKTMIFWHAAVEHFLFQDSREPLFDYFVKTDDDVYFNVTAIGSILHEETPEYWGKCNYKSKPYRQEGHKWHVPKEIYPNKTFPPYAAGAGVVFSAEAARCAVRKMEQVFFEKLMPMEDVASGMLMEACQRPCTNTEHLTNEELDLGRIRSGKKRLVLVHGVAHGDMQAVHSHQPVDSMLYCGKIWGYKAHYAYQCAKCTPMEWYDDTFCAGDCEWGFVESKTENGETEKIKQCVLKQSSQEPKSNVRRKVTV